MQFCMVGKLSVSVGDRFGTLTVIKIFPVTPGIRRKILCKCDCGGSKVMRISNMTFGTTRSCGCLARKHLHTPKGIPTPTYSTWVNMKGRCHNPKATAYPWYGALGITVCDRWRFGEGEDHPFCCFLADVGERPGLSHTLDRIERSGNYEPGNVRWSTHIEQARNRGTTKLYEINSKMMSIREISDETGLSYELLRHRIRRAGWALEDAISAPSRPRCHNKGRA